jgi:hypothetical protein
LDLRKEAAYKIANDINANAGTAITVAANVWKKASLELAKKEENNQLVACDILINGDGDFSAYSGV